MYYTNYGFGYKVEGSFDEVVSRTIVALSEQEFGVLSDIDVSATLKKKLDVDFKQYRILGACNPPFAHKALLEEPEIGLLLPCNVIVYETADKKCAVVAVDPVKNLSIVDNSALVSIAETIRTKLQAALNSFEPVASGS